MYEEFVGKEVVATYRFLSGNIKGVVSPLLSANDAGVVLDCETFNTRFVTYPLIENLRLPTDGEKQEERTRVKELDSSKELKEYLKAVRFDSLDELKGKQVQAHIERRKRGVLNRILVMFGKRKAIENVQYTGVLLSVAKEGITLEVEEERIDVYQSKKLNKVMSFPFSTAFCLDRDDAEASKKYLG